ncbi:FkbM family methyltransferase [Brunnivagina elsteri]|uniref:Methyltransferase FkbM domain-containing protein n=1 Tax=Brunnivagina elsteri CCALA 953 TaxID=987040 RepID=A0A2A2TI66_9CYAN|nr:FkbM family methyltransferase [Calothrix elsteri]PAX53381.1 hypothetical protein CK510_14270 [Calothrix elsteri CCALA 953]
MKTLTKLFTELNIYPVLIDIGSSAETPEIWNSIAHHSIYIGFDPDLREIYEPQEGLFYKSLIINKAITSNANSQQILFNLTKFPQCSSVLKPDFKSISNYLFSDYFTVEKEVQVEATNLNAVVEQFSLHKISWIKTDTQGTDLRIFNSLRDELRNQVLALDIEPGIADVYEGEDLFIDIHKHLIKQGFWLSNFNVCGTVRMKKSVLEKLKDLVPELNPEFISNFHKQTPCWCEARYFRTLEWLANGNFSKSDYVMLWAFSLLDNQIGFASEVALEYERIFGKDSVSQILLNEAISRLKTIHHNKKIIRAIFGKLVPTRIKKLVKKVIV